MSRQLHLKIPQNRQPGKINEFHSQLTGAETNFYNGEVSTGISYIFYSITFVHEEFLQSIMPWPLTSHDLNKKDEYVEAAWSHLVNTDVLLLEEV
jgi:hypothetical protein